MEWLNYHHLRYFWTVVREGGVSNAAGKLRLAQPTVSAQIRMLEQATGEPLFHRHGRRLMLTDVGRMVYRYADEIFAIGHELVETLNGRPTGRPLPLTVGIANALPKLIVYRLLQPATTAEQPVHLVCREGNSDQLVAQLATHTLDVVISDASAPAHVRVRVFNHLLGESSTTVFAAAPLARRLRPRFPRSLNDAPMLVPTVNTATRRALDQWFEDEQIRPHITAEFEDTALMTVFGQAGAVAFTAPTVIEREICRHYRVMIVGRTQAVRERYYAISPERRLKHPAVLALTSAARVMLHS
jgi:LysR family transcriptional activator of nhaA